MVKEAITARDGKRCFRKNRWSHLKIKLAVVQRCVFSPAIEELLVRACLNDAAAIDDQDLVGGLDGR